MPYYDYICDACGPFTASVPMADCQKPGDCPVCATPSQRALLRPPQYVNMDSNRRAAMATNERASHEPKSTRSHGPGCSCCHSGQGQKKRPNRTLHHSNGAKSFPSARPWAISH